MAHDIFICYSSSDRAFADRLAARLRAEGWSVWMDTQIHTGVRWHKEIERELRGSRAVVALWSATARDSDYVLEEATYAKKHDKLLPALIADVEPPYGFGLLQTAKLWDWTGQASHGELTKLLAALRVRLNGAGDALPEPPPMPQPDPPSAPAPSPTPPKPAPKPAPKRQPSAAPAPQRSRLAFPAPGQTFRDALAAGGEGPLMVVIPAGRFLMGSPDDEPGREPDEGPQHEVRIARPFALGVHAVTFDDYDRFVAATKREKPADEGWGRGTRPVINVSWQDAQAYCVWLSEQTGRAYRLPSEAEWEYACRAGTTTPFHFGPKLTTRQANFNGNFTYNGSATGEYRQQTTPVGSFPANAFGLHDMHGNVWEWCQDRWHGDYKGAPSDGSCWEAGDNVARVPRGGSWFYDPRGCRAAYRYSFDLLDPHYRNWHIGFRVCCSSPIE